MNDDLLSIAKELIEAINPDGVSAVNIGENELENGEKTISIDIKYFERENENKSLNEKGYYSD